MVGLVGICRRMSMAPSSLILSRGGIVTYQNESNSLFLHNGGSNDVIATNNQVGRSKSSNRKGGGGKGQLASNSLQQQQQLRDVSRPNSRMSNSVDVNRFSVSCLFPCLLATVYNLLVYNFFQNRATF